MLKKQSQKGNQSTKRRVAEPLQGVNTVSHGGDNKKEYMK